jgi:hypothetical protein
MEPRQDESKKAPGPHTEQRKGRFQIVKLEERIAPCRTGWGGRHYSVPGPCHCLRHGRWACT